MGELDVLTVGEAVDENEGQGDSTRLGATVLDYATEVVEDGDVGRFLAGEIVEVVIVISLQVWGLKEIFGYYVV